MKQLPAFSFSISEYLNRTPSAEWPATFQFPNVKFGPEFSVTKSFQQKPTVVVLTIDFSQVLNNVHRERVIH